MKSTLLSVLPLLSLSILTACSGAAPAPESSEGSASAITPVTMSGVDKTSVTANETSIYVSYARNPSAPGAFTVQLTAVGGATTTFPETNLGYGRYGASFGALTGCTAYTYAVVSSVEGVRDTGSIHTRAANGAACTTGETLLPTKSYLFEGLWHRRYDHDYCTRDSWDPNLRMYPQGSAWRLVETPGTVPQAKYGFRHVFHPGSDPFPCAEDFGEARRASFVFDLTPEQLRRATNATFVADHVSNYGSGACTSDLDGLITDALPIGTGQLNNLNDYGAGWSSLLSGPVTNHGLQVNWSLPHAAFTLTNGHIAASYDGKPPSTVIAGLWAYHDGFGNAGDENGPFEQNNNQCMATVSNIGLQLAYDLPPDTPHNCSYALDCNTPTVTCDGAGDVFAFHTVLADGTDAQVATLDDTATPTQRVTKTLPPVQGSLKGIYVCTTSGSAQACTPLLTQPTSAVACVPGNCQAAQTCPGYAVQPPTLEVTCPAAVDFYEVTPSGAQKLVASGATSFHTGMGDGTGVQLAACIPGQTPAAQRCTSWSESVSRSGWCTITTPPPPPPSCDAEACAQSCRDCNRSRGTCTASGACVCSSKGNCQ